MFPSASFMACASAWTSGGCVSPGDDDRLRPRCARRSRSAGEPRRTPPARPRRGRRRLPSSAAGERGDVGRLERQPMIGLRAGDRRAALDRVEADRRFDAAAPGVARRSLARTGHGRDRSQEVGVERQDDVGPIEVIDESPECARARATAGWFPRCHLACGQFFQQAVELIGERWRRHRSGKNPQAGALRGPLRGHGELHGREEAAPRPHLATVADRLRAVRVVKREDGGLGRASAAPRLAGCSGFPSIFVGRPMWLSASTGIATPLSTSAVAKNSGLPGMISSG